MSLLAPRMFASRRTDVNGKLLAEKVDNIDANDLVISHLRPNPRAPYTVFFPWEPSQIDRVTVGAQ